MGLVKSNDGASAGEAAKRRSPDQLLAELADEQASVRRNASRDLASHPSAAMALCDRLLVETSPSVRAVLFTSLISIQTEEVAGRLAALLRSEDVALRNAAIEALQEMPDALAPHVESLLADPDSDVRIMTVNILSVLRHEQAPSWLISVVRNDPHINVCAAALDGLAEVGRPDMIKDVEDLRIRFSDSEFIGFAIATAIRRMRGQS
jgi:HEAT repeat protein